VAIPLFWIGTDEAGYGARLGPLTISGTLWEIEWDNTKTGANTAPSEIKFSDPEFLKQADQLDWNRHFCGALASLSSSEAYRPMIIGDSKKVFQSGGSLHPMQRIVDSLLRVCQQTMQLGDLGDAALKLSANANRAALLWNALDPNGWNDLANAEGLSYWLCSAKPLQGQQVSPTKNQKSRGQKKANPSDLKWEGKPQSDATRSAESCLEYAEEIDLDCQFWCYQGIKILQVASRIIDEQEFNQGLLTAGNKASLLSLETMGIAKRLLQRCPNDSRVIVDLDRHGGRKKYLAMLLSVFDADWMQIVTETPDQSVYRWEPAVGPQVYFRFCVGGERRFPVATASVISKLLRERCMECFNAFWQNQFQASGKELGRLADSQLALTAGYPVDALRFMADIQAMIDLQKRDVNSIWRNA